MRVPFFGLLTTMSDEPSQIKAHCSQCGGDRNCEVHSSFTEKGGDHRYDWFSIWRILQCKGCDYVFFQRASSDSESYDLAVDDDGEGHYEQVYQYNYWPSLSKRKRPDWLDQPRRIAVIDEQLKDALDELYSALDNNLNTLSAIAIRMSFEVASELLGIQDSTFNGKLKELVAKGHIGELDKSRMSTLIEAGNASAHRGWKPEAEELNLMMDILEHFVHSAFVTPAQRRALDEKAAKMQKLVPARAKKISLEAPPKPIQLQPPHDGKPKDD